MPVRRRYGQPEEIACAVAHLALPEAADATGSSWHVDGGCPSDCRINGG